MAEHSEPQADQSESQGFLSKYMPLRSVASETPLNDYDKFMAQHFNHMKHGGTHTSPVLDAHSNPSAHDQDVMAFTSARGEPLPLVTMMNSDSPKIADKEEERAVQKLLGNDNNMTSGLAAVGVALLTLVAMLGFRIRKRRAMRPAASLGSGTQVSDMSMPIVAASSDNILELRSHGWWSSSSQSSLPATVRYSTSPGSEDSTGGMGVEALIKSADVVAFHLETCPFCRKTFAAMDAEGIEYKKVDMTPEIKEELKQMTGKGSAPSVWIKGTYVGGCNDGTESWHGVKPMLKNGKFQEMLSGNAVFLCAPTAPASSDPATVRYSTSPGSEDSTGGMGVEAVSAGTSASSSSELSSGSSDAPAAENKGPGRYDVSKLVNTEGPGFNQFDPVLWLTRNLSRRLGLAGGLAVFGGLFFVEGDEILKAIGNAEPAPGANELVILPSGLRYTETLIGRAGDEVKLPGAVIAIAVRVKIGDKVIFDATEGEKPVAFKLGQRPFQNVLCEGVEEGIKGMRAGGKRTLLVPKQLAPPGVQLPDDAFLSYEVEVKEVLPGYY